MNDRKNENEFFFRKNYVDFMRRLSHATLLEWLFPKLKLWISHDKL